MLENHYDFWTDKALWWDEQADRWRKVIRYDNWYLAVIVVFSCLSVSLLTVSTLGWLLIQISFGYFAFSAYRSRKSSIKELEHAVAWGAQLRRIASASALELNTELDKLQDLLP